MASTAIMRNERLAYMKFCLEDDDQHISCSDMFTELPFLLAPNILETTALLSAGDMRQCGEVRPAWKLVTGSCGLYLGGDDGNSQISDVFHRHFCPVKLLGFVVSKALSKGWEVVVLPSPPSIASSVANNARQSLAPYWPKLQLAPSTATSP